MRNLKVKKIIGYGYLKGKNIKNARDLKLKIITYNMINGNIDRAILISKYVKVGEDLLRKKIQKIKNI